jgi:hypothetical protein
MEGKFTSLKFKLNLALVNSSNIIPTECLGICLSITATTSTAAADTPATTSTGATGTPAYQTFAAVAAAAAHETSPADVPDALLVHVDHKKVDI